MRSAFILIGVCVLPSATPLSVQPLFRPASSRAGVGPWMQTNGFAERLDPRTRLAELDAQRASLSDSEYLQRMRDIVQDSARELSAACDRGDDEACEALSVEERAKAQWLARGVVSPTGSSEVERQRAEIARLQNELGSISDSLYSRMQGQPAANPTIREARIVLPLAALGTIGWLALPKPTVYLPRPPAAPVGESGLEVPAMVPAAAPMPAAEAEAAATAKYFPGALLSPDLDSTLTTTLEKRGFTAENTLFATSTCPDEVNYKSGEIIDLLEKRWGKSFALGGLGGVPFVGRVGFGAYSHHVPDGGKMLIVFAPHIGIIDDGTVGKIVRPNQAAISTACGAAVGAFKALMKEKEEGKAPAMTADYFDAQIAFIKAKLASRLNEASAPPRPPTHPRPYRAPPLYTHTHGPTATTHRAPLDASAHTSTRAPSPRCTGRRRARRQRLRGLPDVRPDPRVCRRHGAERQPL